MEHNTKQVDSFIKMYGLLKLLLEDNANFTQVVAAISDDGLPISSDNSIHSVTLSKYLNTLKIFGLNVKKEKGKYHLLNSLYKIDLTQNELNAFSFIKEIAANLKDDEKNKKEFEKFIKAFELRFSENTQMHTKKKSSQHKADFSFYFDKFTNKVEICSKFCQEDYKVEIVYYPKGKRIEKKITAKAQELLFRRNNAKIRVLDLNSSQITDIPLDNIISLKQMPVKIPKTYCLNRMTVYGIRGRLAKNYRLRAWEIADGFKGEWLIIKNRDESEDELLKRLLKYGDSCKVITPAALRDKIATIFDDTLKLYK